MGFLDFLQSVASGQTQTNPLLQRVAQQALDPLHPTFAGHDVSGVPVLSGVIRPAVEAANYAGLIGEGAQKVAEATTGAGLAGLGLANRAGLVGMTRANQGELAQILGAAQGAGNPLEQAMAVNQRAQADVPGMGLVTAAVNPLNVVGPVGKAGEGLRAIEGAPAALRGLGAALEGASAVGRAAVLPYEGSFGALGGLFKGVKNAVAPAAREASPALATAADGGATALPAALTAPATSASPAAPAFTRATLSAIAKSGIDPAKLAGLDEDLARYVAQYASPGEEDALIAALRGATAPEAAPAGGAATTAPAPEVPPPATPAPPVAPPVAPAPALTARQDVLDMFGQMGATDKGKLLHDLLTANYGDQGGSVAALRNIYGRAFVGDGEIAAAFDHLLQRTAENPKALAALESLNAPLAHGIPTIEPSPQGATELQNAIRQGLGQPPKKGTQFASAATIAPEVPGVVTGAARDANLARFMEGAHPLLKNPDGSPKVFFHGTQSGDFGQFTVPERPGLFGHGVYLTERPQMAEYYAGEMGAPEYGADNPRPAGPAGPNVKPVYVNLKNPLIDKGDTGLLPPAQIRAYAQARGHDGIIVGTNRPISQGGGLEIDELVAFDPAAIKSATGNSGAFNPANPSLLGLTPGGMGLLPAPLTRALIGGGVGGAAGALVPADSPQGRVRNMLLGVGAGAGVGAGLPAVQRDVLAPLGAVGREGGAALRQAVATGEKNPLPSLSKMLPYIRSIKKTSAMTLPRNLIGALSTTAIGEGNVAEAAGNMRDIWRNLPTLLPALRAAGTDVAARDQALLSALPPRMQAYDAAGMRDLIEAAGVNYERNPTDLGAANVHPLAGAMRGAGLAIATPKTLVMGAASLGLGALEGATLPARAAVQTAMLTPIDQGARMAFAFPEYARALAEAAPGFLQRVRASGQDIAALAADGSFGATDIADPALATEWRALQQRAAEAGGALAKDRLGNFSDPNVATGIVNALFPGGSWNVEQAKVLAKAAARHPQAALGLLHTIEQDYQRHVAEGDPQHAGTWRLTDRTPGFGALVRLANGGAPGDLYLNPAYPVSPVGGEVLNLPRELSPQFNPGMKPYDKARTIAGVLGLGVNPEIDLATYKAGQSDTAPSSQVRLAPVGAFADALAHEHGAPLWANPLGQALTPDAEQTPDLQQQIAFGRYLDPAAIRAGNELIYERRGTTSNDPKNVDLVAQLRDPTSAFYHEALVRGLGGKAATAALGDVVPGSPQAETATTHGGAAAKFALLMQGLPITKAQFQEIAARPDGGVVLSQLRQAQIDAAKLQNPLLAVQDVATPQALGQKVFDQWRRVNAGLTAFPLVDALLAGREQERLGLVPLGTAMAQQQQYDRLVSGQSYGRPGAYPGLPPAPFDPTPLYDLMHYLNGGR